MTIASVIICFNEAAHIEQCIDSLLPFSDEIIVVDSFSTDGTLGLLSKYAIRVEQRVFTDFIDQKNYANSLANSDFIFSIDADEYVSEDLATYLAQHKGSLPDVMSFPRLNKIGDKKILFGSWYPDRKIRLWKRNLAQWGGTIPHESVVFSSPTSPVRSSKCIIHNAYPSVSHLQLKSNQYAHMASVRLAQKHSIVILMIKCLISPLIKMFKGYILKQGFRNGAIGWTIEKNIALETYKKYIFAIERKLKNELK